MRIIENNFIQRNISERLHEDSYSTNSYDDLKVVERTSVQEAPLNTKKGTNILLEELTHYPNIRQSTRQKKLPARYGDSAAM